MGAPTGLEPEMEDAIAASLPDGITLDDLSPEQLAQAEEAIRGWPLSVSRCCRYRPAM